MEPRYLHLLDGEFRKSKSSYNLGSYLKPIIYGIAGAALIGGLVLLAVDNSSKNREEQREIEMTDRQMLQAHSQGSYKQSRQLGTKNLEKSRTLKRDSIESFWSPISLEKLEQAESNAQTVLEENPELQATAENYAELVSTNSQ